MARAERERRYISEYTLEHFPEGNFQLNVPLGPIPEEIVKLQGLARGAAFYRSARRRVDATAWRPEAFYLIEAKIRDPLEGLGRLQTYRDLARVTPDLLGFEGQPIVARLVVPFSLTWIIEAARAATIELIVWKPPWIDDYVRERQLYFTAEYRRAREEKKHLRQLFDLE